MTIKKILLLLGILGFLFIGGIVVAVAVLYFAGTRGPDESEAKKVEGREFGKTADNAGCMKEGLARAKEMTRFEIGRAGDNEAFVEECLKSSRSIPAFCDGVPPEWKLKDTEWGTEQCEKARMDQFGTGCAAVFQAKINFCRGR